MLGVNSANSGVMDSVEVVELEVVTSTADVDVVVAPQLVEEVVVSSVDDKRQNSEVEASSD